MSETVTIPGRFNGPLQSGNGGYSAGAFAALVDGTAEVSLRAPVPLDTPLRAERSADGTVRVLAGESLVAEVRSLPDLQLDVPAPVDVEEARRAAARYRGAAGGPFSRCFVCGLDREDALGVQAGRVDDRDLVASPWTPPSWAADEAGTVRLEIVWAALDCPTYFAAYVDRPDPLPLAVLGRFAARLVAPVRAGEEQVVVAWPLGAEGRKRQAGAAVLSADGEVLARARALLIEPRQG